jgi:hypothetical protein
MQRDTAGRGHDDHALPALAAALAQAGIAHDFRPGNADDLRRATGVLSLSPELTEFYSAAGAGLPEHIPAPLGEISLFPIAKLVDAQAGYRWNARTRVPMDGWPSAWVVVAGQEGDPFIADTGTRGEDVWPVVRAASQHQVVRSGGPVRGPGCRP